MDKNHNMVLRNVAINLHCGSYLYTLSVILYMWTLLANSFIHSSLIPVNIFFNSSLWFFFQLASIKLLCSSTHALVVDASHVPTDDWCCPTTTFCPLSLPGYGWYDKHLGKHSLINHNPTLLSVNYHQLRSHHVVIMHYYVHTAHLYDRRRIWR